MGGGEGSSGPTLQQQQLETEQALTNANLNLEENSQRKSILNAMMGTRVFRGSALSRALRGNTPGTGGGATGAPSRSQLNASSTPIGSQPIASLLDQRQTRGGSNGIAAAVPVGATTAGGRGASVTPPACFSGKTRIQTPEGFRQFDELPEYFEVRNHTGIHVAQLIVHPNSIEPMRRMGEHLVTEIHPMRVGSEWVSASELFHEVVPLEPRTVYNLHVLSSDPDDHHYILENGLTAHNKAL